MVDSNVGSALQRLEAVVIGGSSGGFEALQRILAPLPANFPHPILVVLHRGAAPDALLARLLARSCRLAVKEAEEKEPVAAGVVYLAPPNYHLLVEMDHTLSLTIDRRVCYARPSIDVTFETAADAYRDRLAGILLTGANNDGTAGMSRIKVLGGLTIAQDPSQAHAPAMPGSAVRAGVVDHTLSLDKIATLLMKTCGRALVPANQGV